MYDFSNIKLFGKRLRDLREKRFKESPNRFPYCRNQESFCTKMALHLAEKEKGKERTIMRQTLGRWESGETYPDVSMLPSLCNLLDCNPDYLLGYDNTINREVKTVSTITGLNNISVEELRANWKLVHFLNYLIPSPGFAEFFNCIERESIYYYLKQDLLAHYAPTLKKGMERAFDRALALSSPYDDLLDVYKRELREEISSYRKIGIENSILRHISADIKEQILLVKNDRKISDNSEDYYNLVVNILSDFSYQSFSHQKESEQRLGRIMQMFMTLVSGYFEAEILPRKERIKKNLSKSRN